MTAKSAASKRGLGIDVLTAARARIAWTLDTFPRVYVSFSGGKDSTVMTHLACEEARRRGRRIGLLFVDLEGQYKLTIDHVAEMLALYADVVEPYWVCLPIRLRNAVSQFEPRWTCWDPGREHDWVRMPPVQAITDPLFLPFFRPGMEFEEFVPAFGRWYGQGKLTACLVGIRTDESLNRWRTIAGGRKQTLDGRQWTTWCGDGLYNAYPIYDWHVDDIWTYHARTSLPYNRLYDRMHQAGLTPHQMRICQPYGDDQRKGLWLFHVIEPETWARIVARVNGANQGALYAQDSGNILGNIKITKPAGHTWESFAMLLLDSQPPATREHYRNKIAVFLKWYADRGYPRGIPDEGPVEKDTPSWKRICKALLRNDYWCKGLSFTQQKSEAYSKYLTLMKRRRQEWGLMAS
jgi:predicted phosphoadenosine phosphosulfate sulfurtransferase